MSRKTKIDLIWITLLSLLVQLFWAARMSHPTYFDAYYYSINGRQLATGQGWTEPVIWQYLDAPTDLPAPSHTYWMPLTSIVAAGGHLLAGDGFRAAQLPFVLLTTTLPLLAYAITRHLSRERWAARTAALFTMAGGYYAGQWNQPSTFALFAWVAGGGLLALGLALKSKRPNKLWFAAGLLAGLSHLTRADGVLLLAVGLLLLLWQAIKRLRDWRLGDRAQSPNLPISQSLALVGGYLAMMGGWFIHLWRVTGRPLSTVGTQTMFLTTYDDTFAYGRQFTLQSYLDWGIENIVRSKLTAVSLSAQTFIAVTGMFFLGGFILWAWIKLGRADGTKLFLRPFTLYTIALYASMTFIFTFPGQRGSLFHSSTALWPWAMALAAGGIGLVVEWIAKLLPHWRPEKSKPLFAALFVIIVFVISIALSGAQPISNDEAALYQQLGAQMDDDARVMLGNPLAFHYHTGLPAVVLPNEPPETVLEAMAQYDIDILLLDPDHVQPMADLYEGTIAIPELKLMQTISITTTEGSVGELQWYRRVK